MSDHDLQKRINSLDEEFSRFEKRKHTVSMLRKEQQKWHSWINIYVEKLSFQDKSNNLSERGNLLYIIEFYLIFHFKITNMYVAELEKELAKYKKSKREKKT